VHPTADVFFGLISPARREKLPQTWRALVGKGPDQIFPRDQTRGVIILSSDATFCPKLSKPFAVAPRSPLEHLPEAGECRLPLLAWESPGKGKSV